MFFTATNDLGDINGTQRTWVVNVPRYSCILGDISPKFNKWLQPLAFLYAAINQANDSCLLHRSIRVYLLCKRGGVRGRLYDVVSLYDALITSRFKIFPAQK